MLFQISKSKCYAQIIVAYECYSIAGNEDQLPVKKCVTGIKASPITRGNGLIPFKKEGIFCSTNWPIKSDIDLGDYLEFTITPDCGKILEPIIITMYHKRSLRGPKLFVARTSYDSFTSNRSNIVDLRNEVDVVESYFKISMPETDKPVTIRIYAYKAELEYGNWGIGGYQNFDLTVLGKIKSKPFLINEADIDTYGGDKEEFIEIFDGGCGSKSLDNHLLVFYDGTTNKSYRTIDLSGNNTNGSGYFVVGHENSSYSNLPSFKTADNIKNGSHAIAIYKGNPEEFPDGNDVDTVNLVDALVYTNNTPEPGGLAFLLKKGEAIKDENVTGKSSEYSLQRIGDGSGGDRKTSTYVPAIPTPGAKNFDAVWTGNSDNTWGNGLNWTPHLLTPGQNDKVFIPGGLTSYPSTATIQHADKIVLDDGARINNQENIISNEVSVVHKILYSNSNQAPDRWQYFTPVIQNIRAADLISQNSRNDLWLAKYDNTLSEDINSCWDFNISPESPIESLSGYAISSVYDDSEEGEEKTTPWQLFTMSGYPVDAENPSSVSLKEGWNLTGNPYLTSIDWFDSQSIDYTLIQGNAAYKYNPSTDSYITLISDGNGSGIVIPEGNNQYISSGQGYFLNSISDGTFNLNPGCRADASTPFLKSSKIEDYIKLVVGDDKSSDETFISIDEEASDGFDNRDAEKLLSSNREKTQIYTIDNSGKKLVYNAINSVSGNINLSITSKSGKNLRLYADGNYKGHKIDKIILKDIKSKKERSIGINEEIDLQIPDSESEIKLLISFSELKANSGIKINKGPETEIKYSEGNLICRNEEGVPVEIILSDYSGREIVSFKLKENAASFPVNLSKGIYILTLKSNASTISKKLSINH